MIQRQNIITIMFFIKFQEYFVKIYSRSGVLIHFIKTMRNIQVGISILRKSSILASEKELKVLKVTLLLFCIEGKVDSIWVVLIDWILWEKRTRENISHNKVGMKWTFLVLSCCYLLCSLKWFTKIPKKIQRAFWLPS